MRWWIMLDLVPGSTTKKYKSPGSKLGIAAQRVLTMQIQAQTASVVIHYGMHYTYSKCTMFYLKLHLVIQ